MSLNTVEKVFWEFGNDPSRIERFNADPDGYLDNYSLEPQERQAIKEVNLKMLSEQGMNPLLAMMTWPLLKGPDNYPFDYLAHLNGGKLPEPPDG